METSQKTILFTASLLIISLFLLLFVNAVSQGDVTLISPADGIWINTTNYTAKFNVTWNDPDDYSYNISNCTLYLGNVSSMVDLISGNYIPANIPNISYIQQSKILNRSTILYNGSGLPITSSYLLQMRQPFYGNGTSYLWTVKCFNTSSRDGVSAGWAAPARTIYQDILYPNFVNIRSYSFTNNTWNNTGSVRFEVNMTDPGYEGDSYHNVSIMNDSNGYIFGSVLTSDNQAVNVSATLPDANYTLDIKFCDPALNCNISKKVNNNGTYVIYVDTVDPVVSFQGQTPAAESNASHTSAFLNVSITEVHLDSVIFDMDGTQKAAVGWTDWDDTEDVGTQGSRAYDENWTTYENASAGLHIIYENYSVTTGTDLQGVDQIQFMFQFNIKNSSGAINMSFYNYSANAWSLQYTNSSNDTETTAAVFNKTITLAVGQNFANRTNPLRVMINLSSDFTINNNTVKYYEGQAKFMLNRCSGSSSSKECYYNFTGMSSARNKYFNLTVNDSAGNSVVSGTRWFSIDSANAIGISSVQNLSVNDSVASFRILVSATMPLTCKAEVRNSTWNLKSVVSGNYGTIGASTNCTGTIGSGDIINPGAFTITFNVTNDAGTSNTSNKTGIMIPLYVGWNMLTWGDDNSSLGRICNASLYCTSASSFNNTDGTFTTYSISTPSVNPGKLIQKGQAIYMYVNVTDSLIMNDYMPVPAEKDDNNAQTLSNITINATWWNMVGLFYNVSMNKTMLVTNESGAGYVAYSSVYDASIGKFYTCSRDNNLCTGTANSSATGMDINLPKGSAVWMLPTGDITINRSNII